MLTYRRPQPPRNDAMPNQERILETAMVVRCAICTWEWEAEAIIEEDGLQKCPKCVDVRTAEWKAQIEAEENDYAASRVLRPQESLMPLETTFPGTIRKITDANGVRVYDSHPLNLIRNVAKSLLLLGRDFSTSDTIAGSTGLTISVSARTATLTTLSVTAGLSMAPGNYSLTFNNVVFRNIFSVR